jgi:hypothetical protein
VPHQHRLATLGQLEEVQRPLGASAYLQRDREALARAQREADEARQRQAAARAAAQQATRDLEAAMASAQEAATRLRSGIWARYGRKSVKLNELGMRPYAPARKRETAAPRWGELPQRVPEPSPPLATPEHDGTTPERDGETFPIDARTRDAGAKRPFALGNGSPTSRNDAFTGWQPADGDSSLRDSPRLGLPAGRNERNRISDPLH